MNEKDKEINHGNGWMEFIGNIAKKKVKN